VNSSDDETGCCRHCFLFASAYAWIFPALAVVGMAVLAVLQIDGWQQLYDRIEGCFVLGLDQLLLFTVPIGLIVTSNIAMFYIVACRTCIRPTTFGITPIEPEVAEQIDENRKRYVACVQLTLVLTTTWIAAFSAHFTRWNLLWYLFIGFDFATACTVFFAFVLKKKTWQQFNKAGKSDTLKSKKSANVCRYSTPPSTLGTGSAAIDNSNKYIIRETSI
jgi:hypothetical protein